MDLRLAATPFSLPRLAEAESVSRVEVPGQRATCRCCHAASVPAAPLIAIVCRWLTAMLCATSSTGYDGMLKRGRDAAPWLLLLVSCRR
jgi:cytochrome c5